MFTYCCLSDFNFQISLNVFAWLLQQSTNPHSSSSSSNSFIPCCALHWFIMNFIISLCAFMHLHPLTIRDIKQSFNIWGGVEGRWEGSIVNSLNRKACPLIQLVLIAASDGIMPQRQNSSLKLQHADPACSDSKHFKNKGEG